MSQQKRPPITVFSKVTDKFAAVCYIIEGEPFQNLCRIQNPDGSYNYSDKCLAHLNYGMPYFSDQPETRGENHKPNISAESDSSLAPYRSYDRALAVYSQGALSEMPSFRTFLSHYWRPLLMSLVLILMLAFAIYHFVVVPILERRFRNKQHKRDMVAEDEDGNLSIGKIKFHPSSVLGLGSKGTCVYKGTYEESQDCAIKRIVAQTISFADREVDMLRSLEHPNLVRYLATENDPQFVYIALELAEYTLRSLVDSDKLEDVGLSREEICRQSALGLQYLHKQDIVHRDIKPENILISFPKRPNNERRVLITDFGLSKQLTSVEICHSSSVMRYFDGTQGWMPPEIIKAKEENKNLSPSKSADIFSLGCVFYYIIFNGKHPFGSAPNEREENIKANKNELDLFLLKSGKGNESRGISDVLRVMSNFLVGAMVDQNAKRRPPINSILKYPLFWSKKNQLQFLSEVSDRLDKDKDGVARKIEDTRKQVFGYDWKVSLSDALLKDLNDPLSKHRNYKGSRLQDLLRVIRNKKNHYNDCSSELKSDLGDLPDEFFDYFSSRFPQLIVQIYIVIQDLKSEPKFRDYFCQEEEYVFHR